MLPDPDIPFWKRLSEELLDAVYPPRCALCGTSTRQGRSLCAACDDALPRLEEPFCESCGESFSGIIEGPFACPNCEDLSFDFDFARPAAVRDERTLELVHRLKYNKEVHLARELGGLAMGSFADPRFAGVLEERWPLVPVPLHPKRQRQRHFNQAAEICHAISAQIALPILHALRRVRDTETQTLLSRRQRMENLRGAFLVTRRGHRWIASDPVGAVLVDDVLTTGSTVNECAKMLRQAGFKRVVVVTAMRG